MSVYGQRRIRGAVTKRGWRGLGKAEQGVVVREELVGVTTSLLAQKGKWWEREEK
jgi:hypothetical protein